MCSLHSPHLTYASTSSSGMLLGLLGALPPHARCHCPAVHCSFGCNHTPAILGPVVSVQQHLVSRGVKCMRVGLHLLCCAGSC